MGKIYASKNLCISMVNTGILLKLFSGIAVFSFLIYSLYFTGNYEFTFLKGLLAFLILSIFIRFALMIPFGVTFSPILFEWWWHDTTLWNFSTAAWVVTGLSLVANIMLLVSTRILQSQE